MIDEQFLQTIPQYGIGGFVGKIFKKVKDTVKKVAPIAGAGIGFMIGGSAGAGIGAGIGSLVAGKSVEESLGNAMLGYGIGSVAGRFGPQFLKDAAGSKEFMGFGGKGDIGNLFNMFGGKGPSDKVTKLQEQNIQLKDLADKGNKEAANLLKINENAINQIQVNEIVKGGGAFGNSGALGNTLLAGSVALPFVDYFAQQKAMENYVPTDPMGLNELYYTDPQAYQVSGLGTKPLYMEDLQNYYGMPVEDLPTDFVRAAEGGVIQLADGSEKYFPRKNGQIDGPGTGTSDDIPAMLSDGEFVFTAKAVRNAGGGDRREGAKRMYQVMKNLEKGGNLSNETRGVA